MSPEEVLNAHLALINAEDPPDHDVPPLLANFRHPCTAARQSKKLGGKGVSTAIDLKERYVTLREVVDASLERAILEGDELRAGTVQALVIDPDIALLLDAAAILWREGKCKKCGVVARSLHGRIVDTAVRPPISGRMARS